MGFGVWGLGIRIEGLGVRVRCRHPQDNAARDPSGPNPSTLVLNLRSTTSQKCEAVPRRARI